MQYAAVVTGKGKKRRLIAIDLFALTAIWAYFHRRGQDGNPAIFLTNRGRMSTRTVQRRLRRMGVAAGDDHVHPHRLRHSFATECTAGGMQEKELQERLGHAGKDVLYRYISVSEDEAYAQINAAMRKSYAE